MYISHRRYPAPLLQNYNETCSIGDLLVELHRMCVSLKLTTPCSAAFIAAILALRSFNHRKDTVSEPPVPADLPSNTALWLINTSMQLYHQNCHRYESDPDAKDFLWAKHSPFSDSVRGSRHLMFGALVCLFSNSKLALVDHPAYILQQVLHFHPLKPFTLDVPNIGHIIATLSNVALEKARELNAHPRESLPVAGQNFVRALIHMDASDFTLVANQMRRLRGVHGRPPFYFCWPSDPKVIYTLRRLRNRYDNLISSADITKTALETVITEALDLHLANKLSRSQQFTQAEMDFANTLSLLHYSINVSAFDFINKQKLVSQSFRYPMQEYLDSIDKTRSKNPAKKVNLMRHVCGIDPWIVVHSPDNSDEEKRNRDAKRKRTDDDITAATAGSTVEPEEISPAKRIKRFDPDRNEISIINEMS